MRIIVRSNQEVVNEVITNCEKCLYIIYILIFSAIFYYLSGLLAIIKLSTAIPICLRYKDRLKILQVQNFATLAEKILLKKLN